MKKTQETSLIIKKETIFDKIRKNLYFIFHQEEDLQIIQKLEEFTYHRTPRPTNIIIPKEIKKGRKISD